jgi:hypothetical protein
MFLQLLVFSKKKVARYMRLSQRALAKALGGKAKRTIEKRIAQGMPVDSIEAARAWCEQNLGEPRGPGVATIEVATKGSQGSHRRRKAPTASEPAAKLDDGQESLRDQKTLNRMLTAARIKLTERDTAIRGLQEKQADVDGRIRDGHLVKAEDVKRIGSARAIALRDALLALPAQLALQLAALTDPALVADLLRKCLKQALTEFVEAHRAPQTDDAPKPPRAATKWRSRSR